MFDADNRRLMNVTEYMTAPDKNGTPTLPKRAGVRGMLPSTWIDRTLRLEYVGAAGVAKETISDIERGLRHPHDPTVAKIAKGYGVPVEDLLEEPVPLGEAPGEAETGPKVVRGSVHEKVDARTFKILVWALTGEVHEVIDDLANGEISLEEAHARADRVLEPLLQ